LTSVNPKVSIAYFAVPARESTWTKLRFSAGTGIRPPDAFEIAFTDNPALKPERSQSVEFGVEQAFAAGRVTMEATAFSNHYDDLIVSIGQSLRDASRYRTDNVSNARARGFEMSGNWRAGRGVEIRGGYTWLDTEILAVDRTSSAPPPFKPGDRLIRRPRHQGFVDALVGRGRFSGFTRLKARGSVLDVEPSFGASAGLFDADGFAVVDAGASIRLWQQLVVFGRLENVADRFYEEAFGFPALGRSVTIGVRIASIR
jgi:outer membrane receptor protein involved in Fe transport